MLDARQAEPIAREGLPALATRRAASSPHGQGEVFTAAEIRQLLGKMARIVESHQGKYLEIFQLLEAELAIAEAREGALQRALAMAKSVQQTDNIPCN